MMTRRAHSGTRGLWLLAAPALCACDVVLLRPADAGEARRLCAQLQASGTACQVRDDGRGAAIWVAPDRVADAVQALAKTAAAPAQPGFEAVYGLPGPVPTPLEERARAQHAHSGELAATLAALPGVADARVHLTRGSAATKARAAVSLTLAAGAQAPPASEVAALVAAATPDLRAADVWVRVWPAAAAPAQPALPDWVRVGPLTLTRESLPWLRWAGGASLWLNAALAAAVAYLWRERTR